MSKFAIIKTGGKQYKVAPGQKVKIEKLIANDGDNVVFDDVLLTGDSKSGEAVIGTPNVEGSKVEAKVLKQGRAKKVTVFKYHSKTRYRKTKGHRQNFTEVEITKV